MDSLFIDVFNISLTSGLFILAVVLLRLLLKKAPKAITCFMWGLVGLRLVLPFSVESIFSAVPSSHPIPTDIAVSPLPSIESGIGFIDEPLNEFLTNTVASTAPTEASPVALTVKYAAVVWLVGITAMVCYLFWSYIRVRMTVREAVREEGRVYICDSVKSPFILGVFMPKIYLPSSLDGQSRQYVLAHENAHIKRFDHLWKPIGFILLTVHWFNPLMWLAYILLCRDIEFACDEKVIRDLGDEGKTEYSEALINCSAKRRLITVCPLAFGEVSVKRRILSVLNYKKPVFWVIVVAVIVSVIVGIMFMTNRPKDDGGKVDTETTGETEETVSPETDRPEQTPPETEKQTEPEETEETVKETQPSSPVDALELDGDKYSTRMHYGPVVEKGTQPTEFTVIYSDKEFDGFFDKYNAKYPNCFSDSAKDFLKINTRSHSQGKPWSKADTVVLAIALESNTPWRSQFPHPPYVRAVRKGEKGLEIDIERFTLDTGSTSVIFEFVSFQKRDFTTEAVFRNATVNTFLPEEGTVKIQSVTGLKYETAFITRYTGEGRVGIYHPSVFQSVESINRSFDQYDASFDVTSEYYPKTYREVVSKYDEEFFKNNVLIRVYGVRPEKGVYGIERIDIAKNIMRIVKDESGVIEEGMIDPQGYSSEYYIFIEMSREQYSNYGTTMLEAVTE